MARKTVRDSLNDAVDKTGGKDTPTEKVQEFLDCMASYQREFQKWERRSEKVIKRYRDEQRENRTSGEAKFNILWSNVQTLIPATFSKLPQPDVSRRFRDQDPTGRVAALILERSLDFEIQHYPDYRATMRQCVLDRFLGGRGTAWVRYEPHFKAAESGAPEDGVQVTEDTDEAPVDEALDYECAPVDYVHWRDFGHDVARTWEEVTKVWRNVYMSEAAVTARFGEEVAGKIPYDATPKEDKERNSERMGTEGVKKQALVIELWDKTEGKAYWFSKSMKKVLDEKEDPLGLKEFFPCPRPLYATLTNDTLVPIPDFTLYQDQAKTLDVLSDRIDGLAKMLQVKGTYDASVPELARLFTEGENGTLIPGKNWAAFVEKQGLKGSLQLVDLEPIAKAIKIAAEAMEQEKAQVYEITGISDIIRGQTQASETATAQQIKGQYASLRLRSMQDDVARFATELLQLKAQVICGKFAPATIAAISAAEQLQPADKPLVYTAAIGPEGQPAIGPDGKPVMQPAGPAMALLIGPERIQNPESESPNPLRSFRVEVAADTLVQLDEQRERQDRMEMLTAFGVYLKSAGEIGMMSPQMVPLLIEVGKFGLTAFKVGKQIEGTFDQALDQLKQTAQNPPPPKPDPEMAKIEAQKAADAARVEADKQSDSNRVEADKQIAFNKVQSEEAIAKYKADCEERRDVAQHRMSLESDERKASEQMTHKRDELDRSQQQHDDKMGVEKMRIRASTLEKGIKGINPETLEVVPPDQDPEVLLMKELVQGQQETLKALASVAQGLAGLAQKMDSTAQLLVADREIERDPQTGKALRSRIKQPTAARVN